MSNLNLTSVLKLTGDELRAKAPAELKAIHEFLINVDIRPISYDEYSKLMLRIGYLERNHAETVR